MLDVDSSIQCLVHQIISCMHLEITSMDNAGIVINNKTKSLSQQKYSFH